MTAPSTDSAEPYELLRQLGIQNPERVDAITDGLGDARLWRVEHDGRRSLLRVYRPNLRHVRDREVAAMQAIDTVPVPRIEAVGEPNGLPAMLMTWCDGTTLLQALSAAPGDAWALGAEFGRAHARLHAAPVPESLRPQLPRDWIAWGTGGTGSLDRRLRELPPLREGILHLDYHPLNVLVENGELAGIIDWANAIIGDVRADFARTYSILSWLPMPVENAQARHVRHRFRLGWAAGYRAEAGPLPDLAPFIAWAAMLLQRDLGPKIDTPGFWISRSDLDAVRAHERRWLRRAALTPGPSPNAGRGES
ncbi:MAG TPA: aminoglycoside 3'-phosphotransferase/choline kinase family protein [Nitrolancea sp.]|nr:aminoglycoside 3'-phosphotransferase/choline kinase family protein [Nitrolancea sp.]